MNKPKLLIVADTFYPKVDGTLKFIEEFVRRSSDSFELTLLVPQFEEKQKYQPLLKGVKEIIYIKTSPRIALSGYPSISISWKNYQLIKKTIKESDLVFVQGPALLSFWSIFLAHRMKKKVISYTHVLSWEVFSQFFPLHRPAYKFSRSLALLFYNYSDEVLVPYHELKESLQKMKVKSQISVAKLGVDINRFSPSKDKKASKRKINIKTDKKVIGYVGRISKEKNVKVLLKAFRRLEKEYNLHLLMVGDGPEEEKAEFKELKNCTITGFISDVENYLPAMDIFVMPSTTETTSLATLEAMSSGLPVIATKVGFIKSYIIRNHNGLFFPQNSSSLLAEKIERLLGNPELSQKLGENARKTVAYSFSWERSINRIKRILVHHYKRDE
jgi:glycosyltransferase involved in cell wall biosynthesis